MVVEADESDGTFLRLPATVAIVTNVDPEHLDFYGDFDHVRAAFQSFVENLPFYGFGVLCADHPEVQTIIGRVQDRRVITYGFNPQADARAVNVSFSQGASHFDAIFRDRRRGMETTLANLRLPMPGEPQRVERGCRDGGGTRTRRRPLTRSARRSPVFGGVKRRFTRVGEWNGAAIIDDYGHHPVEIAPC
jgi:UDP-N-acetylmuramate--alanine ligase